MNSGCNTAAPVPSRVTIDSIQATVGAGLPVISTLRSLLETGDKIKRIEGILSGTLSYIFNTYKPGARYTQVVGTSCRATHDTGLCRAAIDVDARQCQCNS